MKLNGIKAVCLDAADTLFYIREGLGRTYAEPARKYGVDPSPDELKKAFSRYFPSAPPLAFNAESPDELRVLERQWWYEVVRNVYEEIGMFDDFDNYFNDLFEVFRTSAWEVFPETHDVLSELKKRDYRIIVISNFDSRVYDVCNNLNIMQYFDDFVISSETGFAKPSPEIFRMALERNRFEGPECVHVGDNYENDYLCPRSIGINAVFLDRDNEIEKDEINRIGNLNELLKLLNTSGS